MSTDMKYLEIKNKHQRDPYIHFVEETHTYTFDGDEFTSVTTWISKLFDKFDTDAVIDNMMRSKRWNETNIYFGKTKDEIKKLWKDKNKEAIEQGTILHQNIEDFLNNINIDNRSIEYRYFLNFTKDHNDMNVFRTEWKVYDESLKLAGTIDMCSMNHDGTISLYDWKRSKSIRRKNNFNQYCKIDNLNHLEDTNFNHYALQLNFYKYIIEKKYNLKVKNMFIVCLHPENKNNDYLLYKIPTIQKEIENIIKFIKKN
jgi:hypothetical protein